METLKTEKKRKTDKIIKVIQTHIGTIVEFENDNVMIIRTNEDLDKLVEELKK